MSQYIPPQNLPPPPPTGSRPRAQSNASDMNRYVPEEYRPPQQTSQPAETGYFIPQRARGPSIGNQQISSTPPFPNSFPGAGLQVPPQQPQPSYPTSPGYQPAGGLPYRQTVNELRPPHEGRKHSNASTYSRHSQRSHHSGRRSHSEERERDRERERRRRSVDDDYDHERRHRHHHRRSSAGYSDDEDFEKEPLKRKKTHRPTLGDTVYSSFRVIKDALGPRDKY